MPERALGGEPPSDRRAVSVEEVCRLLREADLGECELVPWGSNYTFAVPLRTKEDASFLGIYKPHKGERPLWDFPSGLYKREVAAFQTSEALGWGLVPPTVIRSGPHGVGSLQLYIAPREGTEYSTLQEQHHDVLRRFALFDIIANNADRKAGHCFLGVDGRVWGIDHGLTFHAYPKLRTVIWDFQDEPVPAEMLRDVKAFHDKLERGDPVEKSLRELLDPEEIRSLKLRLEIILNEPVFPSPSHHRHFPWPPY